MSRRPSPRSVRLNSCALVALAIITGQAATSAADEPDRRAGCIDFAAVDLPPAIIEVNLSQELFSDLFGLSDAAIEGAIQSLVQSNQADPSKAIEVAEDQLATAREILQLTKEVVREVHVRVYEDSSEEADLTELISHFQPQLDEGNWETVVKVDEGNELVNVSMLRSEGAIVGIFVVFVERNDAVIAHIIGDISPENVKQLTAKATKIGLEVGLRETLERELKHLHTQNE